jgi:hypothetical protein
MALLHHRSVAIPGFSIPAMGYPEGGSILFNDALPLTALASKAITASGAW